MPIKLCTESGCGNTATKRGRCDAHATDARRQNRSQFDSFYGSKAWRVTRAHQLFERPLSQYVLEDGRECGVIADTVHHIVELTDGGAPRDHANLMSVCRSHHSVIHARRRGRVA